jgi:putative addiction module component (TIGR02574 family)
MKRFTMALKMSELGIDKLSVDDRINLMNEIWESLAAETGRIHLTLDGMREIQRRLADHKTNPNDVDSWEEIKEQALARFENR